MYDNFRNVCVLITYTMPASTLRFTFNSPFFGETNILVLLTFEY